MWISEIFLSLLFPKSCIVCKKENTTLCISCAKKSAHTIETPAKYIYATYSYKDRAIKKYIHLIKYYHRKDLITDIVTSTINEELLAFIGIKENIIFVPIPSPKRRIYMRGYNHAEHIAKSYSYILGIPVSNNILLRIKYTPQQAKTKHRSDRERNIRGVFGTDPLAYLALDKQIILIDDTTTTGATFIEARNTLMSAGFKNVKAIAIAH